MIARSGKTSTAILAALSLMQPLPGRSQTSPDAQEGGTPTVSGNWTDSAVTGSFTEICAEAMIAEASACELHVLALQTDAENAARAAADAATTAAAEAQAAADAAAEAGPDEKAAADARAAELAEAADEAAAQARTATNNVERIAAEAEAAAQAATEVEAAEAQAVAEAEAAAEAQAAAEAEEAAQAEADAQAAADADAQAQAAAEAEAEAAAQAAAHAEAEAEAQAAADAEEAAQAAAEAEAEAEAQAAAEAEEAAQVEAAAEPDATAQAAADAEADAQAVAEDEDAAQVEADSEVEATAQPGAADAEAQPAAGAEEAAAETPGESPITLAVEDCPAESVGSDDTITCVEALTPESIAALAADADATDDQEAAVITETITESTHRASSEEFEDQAQPDTDDADAQSAPDSTAPAATTRDRGLSELERAGLVALGAVVVGAILSSGQRVEANTGDRVIVVDDDGLYRVLKDDDAILRQPGSEVRSERFNDGSIRTTVTRVDGTRIVTILDSSGRVLRRMRTDPDGREYLLIDDTRPFEPVSVQNLPPAASVDFDYRAGTDTESLRRALLATDRSDIGRRFSLRQVREYAEVRALAPEINIEAITFATNSAALQPSQAENLRWLGLLMRDIIANDPTELFLIEGHTDAVGNAGYNLLLSDRRAETVALALSEYFGVPTENLIVQGYGERFLRVPTQYAERENRRVAVRRITGLVH